MKEKSAVELALRADLARRGLTLTAAAKIMGMSLQNFQSMVSNRDISPMNAKKLNAAFGYDIGFLVSGEGSLLPGQGEPAPVPAPACDKGIVIPSETAEMYRNLSLTVEKQAEIMAMQQQNISDLLAFLSGSAAVLPKKSASILDLKK